MSAPTLFDPRTIPSSAMAALHAHRAALVEVASDEVAQSHHAVSVRIGDGESVMLPPALGRIVAAALADVADGHAVEVRTVGEEVTTQTAADLLGVSRPFVAKLVDEGALPARRVGTHRRILRADVLSYGEQMRATTDDALQALTDQAQELGMGYGAEPGV